MEQFLLFVRTCLQVNLNAAVCMMTTFGMLPSRTRLTQSANLQIRL